jgi:SAM-dependent methyltransferase
MSVRPGTTTALKASLFFFEIGAFVLGVALVLRGQLLWAAGCTAIAVAADIAGRAWSHSSPVPMPYFMRWVLYVPRGPQSPRGLERILEPRSAERILEIGPGIGAHALSIAPQLLPDGILDALDVQKEMVEELGRRAAESGIGNLVAQQGDAQRLPYPDRTFDAAYLISVLGEIPDASAALRELRRVLKSDGRIVIGEVFVDPDFISLPSLQERATNAGFVFERSSGPRFAYFARFSRAVSETSTRPGEGT